MKELDSGFKGAALQNILDFPFMIIAILEKFGIKNEQHQKTLIKLIKEIVEKYDGNENTGMQNESSDETLVYPVSDKSGDSSSSDNPV